MTTLYNNKNYIFSISIKVLYLFVFLSCFFYIIVQKQVTNHLSDNLSDMLSDTYKNKIQTNEYNILNYYSGSLSDKNELDNKTIRYNNLLYMLNICFVIFFLIIPIVIYYLSKYVFCKDVPIVQILTFNIILYTLVGIIEYIFFKYVASKYIPVTDGEILNVIKNYFLK